MTYAVIETGGKQYKVQEGEIIFVEKIEAAEGDTISFNTVLAASNDGNFVYGNPTVAGASVTAKVIKNGKEKKVIIFKYKSKKTYRNKTGHRQPYTKVQIEKINL